MRRIRAPKVRNSLASIVGKLPSGGMTTERIVAALHKSYQKEIADDTADLIEIALVRLVNQVCGRQSGSTPSFQASLFDEYGVQKRLSLVIQTPHGLQKIWKNLSDVTVAEAKQCVADHERPPVRVSSKISELRRLLTDVERIEPSPDEKLVKAWSDMQASGGKKP